tara:strand:- start:26 stop:241 length:216 start_codon:yes stop_codon:yes gene_type:complete
MEDVREQLHYTQYEIEPVTFIMTNDIPYAEGNIIKYILRRNTKHETKKGRLQDLEKAKHYLELLIKKEAES